MPSVLIFPDDKKRLESLRDGDEKAFEYLYNQYSERLYKNIFSLVKSEDIALDFIQDIFYKVWKNRKNIDTEKSFKSYLYTISNNQIKDYFRELNKNLKYQDYYLNHSPIYQNNVEENIAFKEADRQIDAALQQLNDTERSVFVLCKIEGRSYSDAANLLGISSSTVGNNLVKANHKVKKILSNSALFWCYIFHNL